MKEEWRDIPEFEGYYQVSNRGRVRSLDRKVKHSRGTGLKIVKGAVKRLRHCKRGYVRVTLMRGGVSTYWSLHRLVYTVFIGRIKEGYHIDHIDRDPSNNRVDNLREATPSESSFNTKSIQGTSKYKGVSFRASRGKWRASIRPGHGESRVELGNFATEIEAAKAYNKAASKYHGEFANLNKFEDEDETT